MHNHHKLSIHHSIYGFSLQLFDMVQWRGYLACTTCPSYPQSF